MAMLPYRLYSGLRNASHFFAGSTFQPFRKAGLQKAVYLKQTCYFAVGTKNATSKLNELKKKDEIEKEKKHETHVTHEHHTKGFYHHVDDHHGDPRSHLNEEGIRKHSYDFDGYHWEDYWSGVPKQNIVIVNGQKMIKGEETKPFEYLFNVSQHNIPFWSRTRLNVWGNYNMILKIEFLFFWIPTLIILSIAVPCYTMLYMLDEIVYTTMTVKVIGRQWYWIYEVESPPEDEDEDDE